ncbi:hypothetical protein AGMMS49938_04970 [Fibrobacterales bacterium]|nr:hypothetical protein AGMMS49938_04970 [Fibrobacterales bacterium]
MRISSKNLLLAAIFVLCTQAFAADNIYDKDLVRGFVSLKGDFSNMRSTALRFLNEATGKSYSKYYLDGHAEIGAEYLKARTWFDIDFMPLTPERGNTSWYGYGITWMWGYKLLPQDFIFNIIPSVGPGFELQNIRLADTARVISTLGPTLNLELELRLQLPRLSVGVYGGYKVARHDGWDELSKSHAPNISYYDDGGDVNADKAFIGLKFSWTFLNGYQSRQKEFLD